MRSSCFCAPIHEPNFQFGKEFIVSYNALYDDADIFLVFSDHNEHSIFDKLNPHLRYNPIVCDEMNLDGPITYKKWYGLRHIFANTDFQYVAVVDADCLFIKSVDYDKLFDKKYSSKAVFAANARLDNYHGKNITKVHAGSIAPFSDTDRETITKILIPSHGVIQYFWFNDIPVYRRDHFAEFEAYVNMERMWKSIDFWCFDYISYVYFMLLKNYVTLINTNVSCDYGILEKLSPNSQLLCAIQQMKPMWIMDTAIIDKIALTNVFMLLHVDRPGNNK